MNYRHCEHNYVRWIALTLESSRLDPHLAAQQQN